MPEGSAVRNCSAKRVAIYVSEPRQREEVVGAPAVRVRTKICAPTRDTNDRDLDEIRAVRSTGMLEALALCPSTIAWTVV
jgi:hypothetical protein